VTAFVQRRDFECVQLGIAVPGPEFVKTEFFFGYVKLTRGQNKRFKVFLQADFLTVLFILCF
jgi:hypothetical protein